jgi:hypothetical protein
MNATKSGSRRSGRLRRGAGIVVARGAQQRTCGRDGFRLVDGALQEERGGILRVAALGAGEPAELLKASFVDRDVKGSHRRTSSA